LSQSDSLHCFTTPQVQQFLFTKVELENCLFRYDIAANERDSVIIVNNDLNTDLQSTKKKLKRTRKIAFAEGGALAVLIALLIIFN